MKVAVVRSFEMKTNTKGIELTFKSCFCGGGSFKIMHFC
jgi:hypothetical protein